MMTRAQRERAIRLVETLLDLPPDRRTAMLEAILPSLGEDGPAIRAEVKRLLEEDDSLSSRLKSIAPVLEEATRFRAGAGTDPPSATAGTEGERVPSVIGRYHLRGPIGGGGMGVVYLADQRAPIARTVAIKLIRAGFYTHEVLARFDAERQALSRMDHPNIARVFDAGTTDAGRPYFVMEYVKGVAITDFADQQKLSIRDRLALFAQVCDAVAHAHIKGVIHRDLKPSNVLALLDDHRTATVKVIDFGIAKALSPTDRLGPQTSHTTADLVLGTYEYMSPEQAAGLGDLDTRTDVYSLGVLLYELLTGVRPFERGELPRDSDEELRRVIRDVDPPRPSSRILTLLRPGTSLRKKRETDAREIAEARRSEPRGLARMLQRELEWIPMMAMRKDRARRYRGAADLAADVRRFLAGQPLVAAPESKRYRARKFVAAHRRAIAAGAAALVLLVAGVIGTSVGLVRESAAHKLADANGQLASRAAYRSAIAAADVALRAGDGVALRWALDAAPVQLRGWEWHWISHASEIHAVELRREPGERFRESIALPDNRRAWTTYANGDAAVLWDLATGERIRLERGRDLAADTAGCTFAIVRPDGTIEVADIDSGQTRLRIPPPPAPGRWQLCPNAFSRDGSNLVAWDGSRSLTIVDLASGATRPFSTGVLPFRVLGFIDYPDDASRTGVMFNSEETLTQMVLDPKSGIISKPPHFDILIGRRPFANIALGQLRLMGPGSPTFNVPQRVQSAYLTFLPNSGFVATSEETGSVLLHGVQPTTLPGEPASRVAPAPRRLVVGTMPVTSMIATSDERQLIVTLQDGSARACPVEPPTQVSVPMSAVRGSALSPDETRFVSSGWGEIQCMDALTGLPLWGRNLGPWQNRYIAWSPDGKMVVVVTDPIEPITPGDAMPPSEVFVLDGNTGEQLAAFSQSPVTPDPSHAAAAPLWARGVRGITFSADSKRLLIARINRSPVAVDVATWQAIAPATMPATSRSSSKPYPHLPGSLMRSHDGKQVAEIVGGAFEFLDRADGDLVIRDCASLQPTHRVNVDGAATIAAWSVDDRELFVGVGRADDAFVVAYDVATGRERFRVPAPDGSPVVAIASTVDGSRVLAFTRSQRMMIIDAGTGELLLVSSMPHMVSSAFLTRDGALVTADDANGLARTDSHDSERLLAQMQGWPHDERPASVSEARRTAAHIVNALTAAQADGRAVPEDLETFDELSRKLLLECARRHPANINILNSNALAIMLADAPKPQALMRAIRSLRLATSIKLQSATLQNNLGTALFREGDFTGACVALREALRLYTLHESEPDLAMLARLSIAANACGDADAGQLRERALRLAATADTLEPETRRLVDQLRPAATSRP